MKAVFFKAVRMAFAGLLIGPGIAVAFVLAAIVFDPKCGVGDSGGCAMGVVTAPLAVALPSMALFFIVSFFWGLWKLDRSDPLE
jgi:hypothetical protein